MRIAAHQPNFLPWLGFFDRVRRADRFVLVDHVQFERQNFQNRTRVPFQDAPRWLTVPVVQKSQVERIFEKKIFNERDGKLRWGRKLYRTLEQSYRGAPFFPLYSARLSEIFDLRWDKLLDLNLTLLAFCFEALEIRTPCVLSSTLGVEGQKSDMVLDLCMKAGATAYLAGDGASRQYLELDKFEARNLRVEWQGFLHPTYPQRSAAFLPGMSVLDLLFNCGPRSPEILAGVPATLPRPVPRPIPVPVPLPRR